MIKCNTKPVFTKEQIAECYECPWLSKKKVWCSNPKVGCYIHEPERKVKTKKVVILKGKPQQYPSIMSQVKSFGKAATKQVIAGNPRRNDTDIAIIKSICELCIEYNKDAKRCRLCGCHMERKWPWKTTVCKKGKW